MIDSWAGYSPSVSWDIDQFNNGNDAKGHLAPWRCGTCLELQQPGFQLPGLKRQIHIGQILMPPIIFTGLFLALWTYKCIMLVLFQNAIIYNPFLPPNARSMQISDYARQCGGIQWREERIKSLDGTEIALCVSEVASGDDSRGGASPAVPKTPAYLLYFQGNASSLPPRLPDISGILRRLKDLDEPVHYTVICVSYRGYWTSHDRPSEKGIDKDTEAALRWVSQLHHQNTADKQLPRPAVILWGQSIGCGFATNLAAKTDKRSNLEVDALVLETPFTNTRAMLYALYPQKWLPYQYLWPFLRNHLDSLANIEKMTKKPQDQQPAIYIVEAGRDELVPSDHGTLLYQRCQDVGLFAEKHRIRGAYHNDVMVRKEGKHAIVHSISSAVARARVSHSQQKQIPSQSDAT
ncbi:Protein bem46-like protein [Cladobotryum mycophilum]|uniref:Protein bem46-like protein n=1 Tax=Cladobotryum mycophilum TaxID=491253 RepID=A0ABR0SL90_9HYPO